MDLSADVGTYAWEPTAEHIANANITRLMRRLQIHDYRQLVQRSQADIGWFWAAVVNDLGIAFFKPYDQTVDTSHGVQWARWFSGSQLNLAYNCVVPTKACSVGVAGLGMAMDVYDADGKPVRGALGELVCKQPWPSMTRGFWNDPERYIEVYWSRWAGVWVHGDWARVDGDDYWFVTGRSDDTMNIAGKRIGPSEVEAAAVKHPAVAECAAVGIPDEVKGTVIWCFCSLVGSGYALASLIEELKQLVASELGKPFTPAVVKVIPELRKTRSGKVLRRVLRCCILGEPQGDLSTLENPHSLAAIGEALRT